VVKTVFPVSVEKVSGVQFDGPKYFLCIALPFR
jgi:hypothetical protein